MEIDGLIWLAANEAKLAAHGIRRHQVEDLISSGRWVILVHASYPDQIRIVGPATSGRFVTVVLGPTSDPTVWRPVTGWASTPREVVYYRQHDE